jgi:hypothetical protein
VSDHVGPLSAPLPLRWFARLAVDVGAVRSLGQLPAGERRVVAICGGRASGGIDGTIEPGGADWQWVRSDGITEIAAHYVIRCRSGHAIEVHSNGYRHGPPDVMRRLAAGEAVDPSLYHFRTALSFRTTDPSLARLNGTVAIAVGERRPGRVLLEVYTAD